MGAAWAAAPAAFGIECDDVDVDAVAALGVVVAAADTADAAAAVVVGAADVAAAMVG